MRAMVFDRDGEPDVTSAPTKRTDSRLNWKAVQDKFFKDMLSLARCRLRNP
jgi:hypothetical protein